MYLQPIGVDIQANTGILVVVVSLALQLQMKPFVSDALDNLEAASLITQFLTLSIGMYFFSEGTTDGAKIFLTVIIFFVNIMYLTYARRGVYASSVNEIDSGTTRIRSFGSDAKKKLEGVIGRPISFSPRSRSTNGSKVTAPSKKNAAAGSSSMVGSTSEEESETPRIENINPMHARSNNPDVRLEMQTLSKQAETSTTGTAYDDL